MKNMCYCSKKKCTVLYLASRDGAESRGDCSAQEGSLQNPLSLSLGVQAERDPVRGVS